AATRRRVRFIAMAVERFCEDHGGRLPESLSALAAGSGERIAALLRSASSDSWGRPLRFTTEERGGGKATFDVVILRADGRDGGDADIGFSDQKPLSAPERGDRSEGLQSKLASSMGLVFQLDAMDHNRPNWRNSDLSVDQVQARLERAGTNADELFAMLDG